MPLNFKSQVKKPFVTAKGSMIEKKVADPANPAPQKFALMTKKGIPCEELIARNSSLVSAC